MISWQSIMSVFNTKGTLLKWLKTLDQSLKDGVLQSVSVNPVSEGVITLSFNFADGSVITTPQIDIPQGAQGPQGPQGPQGVPGPQGPKGEPGTSPTVNIIEYAEELPTASETSPEFVQTPDGVLYRKKAVEGGGLLGTWVFNDNPSITETKTFNIKFLSDSKNYISLETNYSTHAFDIQYNTSDGSDIAYSGAKGFGSWGKDNYRTIQITDISSLTNVEEFTQWLTANATGGGGGAVTYSYVAVADAA